MHLLKKYITTICLCLILFAVDTHAQAIHKSFLVCGDSKVMIVDYTASADSTPKIIWSYDAHEARDLPEEYRMKKFNTMDDCKAIDNGRNILVSSSSGAIAIIEKSTKKVLFYASVPNAHSIERLPGNFLVAAASTAAGGNRLILFDRNKNNQPLFHDSLYSGHGVVWDNKRKSLFSLGFDDVREYKLLRKGQPSLKLVNSWKLPAKGGHDLQMGPDGNQLFLTIEHAGAWTFNIGSHAFTKTNLFTNSDIIKSAGQDKSKQCIYTIPEESWWTFHVQFANPQRSFAFPGLRLYKARWYSIR